MSGAIQILKFLASSLIVWSLVFAVPGQTDEYDLLWSEFDARPLTQDEKRFLQAGLAFEGLYKGLLDGKWGGMSQRALELYSVRETDSSPVNIHMATLAFRFVALIERDGWDYLHLDDLNISLLFPFNAAEEGEPFSVFSNWLHTESSLELSMGMADLDDTQAFHEYVVSLNDTGSEPYIVRKPGLAVTSLTSRDGSTLYLRSDYTDGAWSSIMLTAEEADGSLLNAVAGSITVGYMPPLDFIASGLLGQVIDLTLALAEEDEDAATGNRDANAQPSNGDETTLGGTGTAFVVSNEGHLLTNAHVVEGCEIITVNGLKASVLETSTLFDLALVQSVQLSGKQVAAFAHRPAMLNLDIVVAGYPLGGLLGGFNITRGTVSGLKGLAGSESTMQISAPVQPGNSGGPVLAADGSVVGVVVSKLDAMAIAELTGDIPQNVNFAVRGELAKLFLVQNGITPNISAIAELTGDIPQNVNFAVRGELAKLFLVQNGITPNISDSGIRLDPVELGQRAHRFTYLVECMH